MSKNNKSKQSYVAKINALIESILEETSSNEWNISRGVDKNYKYLYIQLGQNYKWDFRIELAPDYTVSIFANNRIERNYKQKFKFNSYEELKNNWNDILFECRKHEGVKRFNAACPSEDDFYYLTNPTKSQQSEIDLLKELQENGIDCQFFGEHNIAVQLADKDFIQRLNLQDIFGENKEIGNRDFTFEKLIEELEKAKQNAKKLQNILKNKGIL